VKQPDYTPTEQVIITVFFSFEFFNVDNNGVTLEISKTFFLYISGNLFFHRKIEITPILEN